MKTAPEDHPGATVLRGVLRLRSHEPPDLADELGAWLDEQRFDGFVRHLVVTPSVDFETGLPKGRRYTVRAVVWPWPDKGRA